MSNDIGGFDPVAKLEELNGDLYQFANQVSENLDDDYVLINVVHGDVYVAEVVSDPQDAHLFAVAEVTPGMVGDSWVSTDKMANGLDNDGVKLVDVFGADVRYVTEVNE